MPDYLVLACVGIGIVFAVQLSITLVVALIRRVDQKWQEKEKETAQSALHKEPTLDDTTIVLISAAVATLVGGRHRIHSIRRLLPPRSTSSPWSSQGRSVLQGSHVVVRKS